MCNFFSVQGQTPENVTELVYVVMLEGRRGHFQQFLHYCHVTVVLPLTVISYEVLCKQRSTCVSTTYWEEPCAVASGVIQ
jgi:hypothetical protein